MNKKVIAITLFRRPNYTAQLFEALKRCYGIDEYIVLISCDYDARYADACDTVLEQAHMFVNGCREGSEVFVHEPRLGVDLNKLFILPKAFTISEYCIFLEDDTPIAPDGLRFFEVMGSMFKGDKSVISISGYNRYMEIETHQKVLAEERYHVDRGTQFCPWGWAMWKDRYDAVIGDGENYKDTTGDQANGLFDHFICGWMANSCEGNENPVYTVYPVLPRTQHVGGENAEHTPSQQWLMENEFNPYGAWSQPMPDPSGAMWTIKW